MKRRSIPQCPRVSRDGRCCPGAWLCPLCQRWHYLKRNPVRRGTLPGKRGRAPIYAGWDKL